MLLVLGMLTSQMIMANPMDSLAGSYTLSEQDSMRWDCSQELTISVKEDGSCLQVTYDGLASKELCNLDARAEITTEDVMIDGQMVRNIHTQRLMTVENGVQYSVFSQMASGETEESNETFRLEDGSLVLDMDSSYTSNDLVRDTSLSCVYKLK